MQEETIVLEIKAKSKISARASKLSAQGPELRGQCKAVTRGGGGEERTEPDQASN